MDITLIVSKGWATKWLAQAVATVSISVPWVWFTKRKQKKGNSCAIS